jgi:copper(I)-binding protein
MNLRRPVAIFVTAALILGGAAFLVLRDAPVQIRAEAATAVPLQDEPGALRVFLTLVNDGGADRLIGATSPVARQIELIAPTDAIPLPAHSSPSLALDGAHLRMVGVGDLGDGAVLPLTLRFASGAQVATRAVLNDPIARGEAGDMGLMSLGGICRVGDGEPAPQLTLEVTPDGDGWQVRVLSHEFTFSETVEGLGHVPGYGHGHLYLNGVKLQRMYTPEAHIGALAPGAYQVEVTLNTNDHRAYVVGDTPVTAQATINVP